MTQKYEIVDIHKRDAYSDEKGKLVGQQGMILDGTDVDIWDGSKNLCQDWVSVQIKLSTKPSRHSTYTYNKVEKGQFLDS